MRTLAVVLTLMTALPALAQEGKPAALKIRADAKPPEKATNVLGQFDKLVSEAVGADETAKKAAREKLIVQGLMSAIVVGMRLKKTTDEDQKAALEALSEDCRRDSPNNAKLLFNLAIALGTVSKDDKMWKHPQLHSYRLAAKLIHVHYCKAEPYEKDLEQSLTMITPFRALPASADLFGLAGAMYERLAGTATDAEAAKLREAAKRCHAAAASRRKVGVRSK